MSSGLLDRPAVLDAGFKLKGVTAFTTLRGSGLSDGRYRGFNLGAHVGDRPDLVAAHRRALSRLLPEDAEGHWLQQGHGSAVHACPARTGPAPPVADASWADRPGPVCAVLTADCLPVVFASAEGVAVAHAGWRGLASGVLEKTVAALPGPREGWQAWIGPGIGACCFEVGAEVGEAFGAATDSAVAAAFRATGVPGKYRCDLYTLATLRLHRLGVERVSGGGLCTCCDADRFYSYRREGQTGRMATLVFLTQH